MAESDAIWKANKDLLNRYQEYLAFPTEGIISDEELQRASELSNRLEEINSSPIYFWRKSVSSFSAIFLRSALELSKRSF